MYDTAFFEKLYDAQYQYYLSWKIANPGQVNIPEGVWASAVQQLGPMPEPDAKRLASATFAFLATNRRSPTKAEFAALGLSTFPAAQAQQGGDWLAWAKAHPTESIAIAVGAWILLGGKKLRI